MRQGHASLSGCTKRSANELIQSSLFVGVWHDDTMVLGTHVRLDSLSVGTSPVINVLSGLISSNKGNCTNRRIVAQKVDSTVATMNDLKTTV
jgi:hypothetical protein